MPRLAGQRPHGSAITVQHVQIAVDADVPTNLLLIEHDNGRADA